MHSKEYQLTHMLTEVRRSPIPTWKRGIDITCCLVALPLLALTTLVAAVITKCFSPGPILFRQERIGYRGRRFSLFKFRTMHSSVSTVTHQAHFEQLMKSNVPMQKLDARGDARLIPGGWLLRASGLDELPQIINVLRGEMSIVGPRPCIAYEYERYSSWQRNRLESVPGLTGLWQVSGKNRTTFDEMIRLDIRYSEKMSFASDVAIILKTVPALCSQILDTRLARRRVLQTSNVVAVDFKTGDQQAEAPPPTSTEVSNAGTSAARDVGRLTATG